MNSHKSTIFPPNLIIITLKTPRPKGTKKCFLRKRRPLRSFAASWVLNALLRIFAMSIITPKRKVLRMSVQDRKSGSAGMPRPISYAVFCLKKKNGRLEDAELAGAFARHAAGRECRDVAVGELDERVHY